jgi:hypothetical protein
MLEMESSQDHGDHEELLDADDHVITLEGFLT